MVCPAVCWPVAGTYVMAHNDEGFASILPLLTITSLTFQIDANA
jgi:hypothetical protein